MQPQIAAERVSTRRRIFTVAAAVIGADPIVRRRGLVRKLVRVGRDASKFTSRRYLEEGEPVGKEAPAIIQMSGLVFCCRSRRSL